MQKKKVYVLEGGGNVAVIGKCEKEQQKLMKPINEESV